MNNGAGMDVRLALCLPQVHTISLRAEGVGHYCLEDRPGSAAFLHGLFARDALGIMDYLNVVDNACRMSDISVSVSFPSKDVRVLDRCRFAS